MRKAVVSCVLLEMPVLIATQSLQSWCHPLSACVEVYWAVIANSIIATEMQAFNANIRRKMRESPVEGLIVYPEGALESLRQAFDTAYDVWQTPVSKFRFMKCFRTLGRKWQDNSINLLCT